MVVSKFLCLKQQLTREDFIIFLIMKEKKTTAVAFIEPISFILWFVYVKNEMLGFRIIE